MIFEVAAEWSISHLPGMVARLVYPPRKVESKIAIDLRPDNPINAANVSIPDGASTRLVPASWMDIYLTVRNNSLIPVILERLVLEFWIGQPVVVGSVLRRYVIAAHSSVDVHYQSMLGWAQRMMIQSYRDDPQRRERMMISAFAYFESKIGTLYVATPRPLERDKKYILS